VKVLWQHDAGHRDQDVEVGKPLRQLHGEVPDGDRVGDVEDDGLDTGVVRDNLRQPVPTAPGDDDPVACRVQPQREAETDAGGRSGDEDGVACEVHRALPVVVDGEGQ
jgi:hypothetical protein